MQEVIKAIAEPTRFKILQAIQTEELPAGVIAKKFPRISRPAVSQHIRILKDAGLISERRVGAQRLYLLQPEGFSDLKPIMELFWDSRLLRMRRSAESWRR